MSKKPKTRIASRDADSGRFVKPGYAAKHPKKTINRERVRIGKRS